MEDECDGYCLIWEEHYDRCIRPRELAKWRAEAEARAARARDEEHRADGAAHAADGPMLCAACQRAITKEVNA